MPTDAPTVALVHDHIVQRGGGERVLLGMTRAFPDAPVYTSFYRPELTFPDFASVDVRPMDVIGAGLLRRHHRAALPVFPLLFNRLHVDADVVLCSSSGWAQGARTRGRKVVFFQALAQWVYSRDAYLGQASAARRAAGAALRPWLSRWDQRTTRTADRIAVCGPYMQARVRTVYGSDATIIAPAAPVVAGAGPERAMAGLSPGYFLCPGRLVPSKNIDKVIAAFARLENDRLVVAGDGPERLRLQSGAPPNVVFLGDAEDEQMRWLYRNCRAVICAGIEAYGLTPVEAATFGRPSIALAAGGLADTVREGETGLLFDDLDAIDAAVRRLSDDAYDTGALAALARRHTQENFAAALRRLVAEVS